VQANIHAFIILYVHRNLFREMQAVSVCGLDALEIGAHHVVVLAGGDALGEFASMV
jgi:hypothetical protein